MFGTSCVRRLAMLAVVGGLIATTAAGPAAAATSTGTAASPVAGSEVGTLGIIYNGHAGLGASAALVVRRPLVRVRTGVIVNADGNGASAVRFPTAGRGDLRYVLVVETGCAGAASACPPAVSSVSVSLNDNLVLSATAPSGRRRVAVTLNPAGGDDNDLLITANGVPRSAVRAQIVAIRTAGAPRG